MKQELEQSLKDKFPKLYAGLNNFQCSDGWFKILELLSRTIDFHSEHLPPDLQNQIKVVQVKEKFGGLRFYTNKSTPYIDGAIAMAEAMSYIICEQCSEPGSIRNVKGYYFCGCEKHFEEYKKTRE